MISRSASLHGYVEFRLLDAWFEVVNVGVLIPKHYDLFGLLFGVANHANFSPLFPNRGLPVDCGAQVRADYEACPDEWFGATWASYEELASIDWDVDAEGLDDRIHEFTSDGVGAGEFLGKRNPDSLPSEIREGVARLGEFRTGDRVYRRCRIRRAEAKEGTEFGLLMSLMGTLSARFGDGCVRLVVYFD